MKPKTYEVADKDRIEAYEATAQAFFQAVLDTDYDSCLVTDESRLSDFSSCGLPDELAEGATGLTDLYRRWDKWVLPRIQELYGVQLERTSILVVDLLQLIEDAAARRVH